MTMITGMTMRWATLGCDAAVLSLDPHSLAEVLDSILTVGRRARVPDSAAGLADGLRARSHASRPSGLGAQESPPGGVQAAWSGLIAAARRIRRTEPPH